MAGNLRICRANGCNAPIGSVVTFDGKEIGHVVKNCDGYCEIAINSDIVNSWIRANKCSFSLEVVYK